VSGPDSNTLGHRLSRMVGNPLFWVIWVGLIFTTTIVRAVTNSVPEPPPVLGEVPAFELVNEKGEPYGSDQLQDRIWVANFIFTRCTTVCPIFTGKMGEIQHSVRNLKPAIQLVSFSVDPEYDTPEVLKAYAYDHRASPRLWTFLTGPIPDVRAAVVNGLKTSMGQDTPNNPESIFHGSHFVLVDAAMQIRGLYDVNDQETKKALMMDIQLLAAELTF